MTNLMHTCFILQYVHYNPLHVLLTVRLSISLDNDQLDAHLSVPTSKVKQPTAWLLKMGTISCSETLVENYQSTLRIIPQGRRFHLAIICVPKLSVLRQWPTWCTLALFYNTSTTILYMFRASHAHHQEVELYWCSIWYRHSQSLAVRCAGWDRTAPRSPLSTCAPKGHWLRGWYRMLHQYNSTSWWWACNARNM